MEYTIGQQVTVSGTFTDSSGNLVDPTTVTASVKSPSGVTTSAAVIKDGVGQYHFVYDLTEHGNWFHRMEGTGANKAAKEGTVLVTRSNFL